MVQLYHRRGSGRSTVPAGNPTHLRRTQPASASKWCGHDGVPATDGFADRGAGWRYGGRLERTVAGFTNQCQFGPGVQRSLPDRDGKIGPAQMADRGVARSRTRGADVHCRLGIAISLIDADQGHLPSADQPQRERRAADNDRQNDLVGRSRHHGRLGHLPKLTRKQANAGQADGHEIRHADATRARLHPLCVLARNEIQRAILGTRLWFSYHFCTLYFHLHI